MTGSERDERRGRVVALTMAGRSAADIAAILRVSARTVTRDRGAAGIAAPCARRLSAAQLEVAERLIADGAPAAEVARSVACAPSTVLRRWPHAAWTRQQHAAYMSRRSLA